MTLASLFDGSGGFPLGACINGITPLWASEIEPFPIRVTTKQLPQMKHYGDVSKINGAEVEPVDIITFGSPCQDMSVAGKRAGLDGERSGLFHEAVRIIKEMRGKTNGAYPRYAVWENVPGAFSSNKGEDFRCVLEEMCRVKDGNADVPRPADGRWLTAGSILGDGYSVAWRVLDAQYWGVPQRRKRIYLVADFTGWSAEKILFESESLFGDSAESFKPWQSSARSAESGIGAAGFDGYNGSITGDKESTLGVNCGMSTGHNGVVLNDQGGNRMDITEDVTCTLRAEAHHPPCVMESAGFCTEHSAQSRSIGYEEEKSPTLACTHAGEPVVSYISNEGNKVGTLDASYYKGTGTRNGVERPIIAESYGLDRASFNQGKNAKYDFSVLTEQQPTMTAKGPGAVAQHYIVRRPTPTECARLQGFPDWWCSGLPTENPAEEEIAFFTDVWNTWNAINGVKPKNRAAVINWLKDPYSDSAEYKMWGNGVALPCVHFVLRNIKLYNETEKQNEM